MTELSSKVGIIPIVDAARIKVMARSKPKVRRVDPLALTQAQALLA